MPSILAFQGSFGPECGQSWAEAASIPDELAASSGKCGEPACIRQNFPLVTGFLMGRLSSAGRASDL